MPDSKFSIGPRLMIVSGVGIVCLTLVALAALNPDTANRLIDAMISIMPGVSSSEGVQ